MTELMNRLGNVPRTTRGRGIRRAVAFLGSTKASDEKQRVRNVQFLLATLPDSIDGIRTLLSRFEGWVDYEVHFSIFCWLDEVEEHPQLSQFRNEIPSLAEQYLCNVPQEVAKAAWMAGHFLGGALGRGSSRRSASCRAECEVCRRSMGGGSKDCVSIWQRPRERRVNGFLMNYGE